MNIICIHCLSAPATFHLLSTQKLALMKPNACIISEIIDETAPVEMIKQDKHEKYKTNLEDKPDNARYPVKPCHIKRRQPAAKKQNGGKRTHQHNGNILTKKSMYGAEEYSTI